MENSKKVKIRVSIVSYLNTLPFIYGLKKSPIIDQIKLSLDTPAECARKLIHSEADLGLVPVASISEIKDSSIVSNYCIGANGAVETVLLLSNHPIDQVKTIYLDTESRTSVKLVRVLADNYWKRDYRWQPLTGSLDSSTEPSGYVMIGNKAFTEGPKYKYRIDLAEEWKKFTGLPFVFACWVANKRLPQDFILDFDKAMRHGVENIPDSVNSLKNTFINMNELRHYLEHSISFHYDEAKKEAMELFLKYAKSL